VTSATDLPIVPLWHEDNVVLSNVDVQGYTIVPNARFVGLIGASKAP
jgi:ABC-type transport system substrate-binding protein